MMIEFEDDDIDEEEIDDSLVELEVSKEDSKDSEHEGQILEVIVVSADESEGNNHSEEDSDDEE